MSVFAFSELLAGVTLLLYLPLSLAQETPYFEYTWNEGDGTTSLSSADLEYFGQTAGRYEVDITPNVLSTTGVAQQILHIPGHLGLWLWNDGIHGEWYNETNEQRLFRTRWGLPSVGAETKIVVTWDTNGYATVVDSILRIHDWQTSPTAVFPDPDITVGVYGSAVDGSKPVTGSFKLRAYDQPLGFNSCLVDTVGAINETVPSDNSGSWSQGVDPNCGPPGTGKATLSWAAPTENTDGTPLTDLAGFKLFRGATSGGPYSIAVDIPNPTTTTYEAAGLTVGDHYFVATAYNVAGVESAYSTEATKTIVESPTVPLPPSNLVVNGNLVAYSVSISEDVFLTYPVGTIPAGTTCNADMSANGLYLVPVAEVVFAGEADATVVFAECGTG